LGQTWRHVLLREALGVSEPKYAHLPLIMDMQGRKLSKRDGDVEVESFRKAGFLPEALLNFLALLGWNPGNDIEKFTLPEFCELFSTDRIGKSNAKFDRDKLSAFNADAIASVSPERLLECFKDYLSRNETVIPAGDDNLLKMLLEAHRGMKGFGDIIAKCGVLFSPDDSYDFDAKAVEKNLAKGDNEGWQMLETLRAELAAVQDFSADALDKWIHDYCEKNSLGMGKVAQPLRIAVTGSTVSPGIGVTLSLLGKEKTLARIDRCLASRK
jgi:glutamyl-tRNA synthetase